MTVDGRLTGTHQYGITTNCRPVLVTVQVSAFGLNRRKEAIAEATTVICSKAKAIDIATRTLVLPWYNARTEIAYLASS